MSEEKMPTIEAEIVDDSAEERNSYELAFHILPTIAEEEVSAVYADLKAAITASGGEMFAEEAPERFDLAYEIEKHFEGKNKKYRSAYFGWVRFKAMPEAAVAITEEVDGNVNILRHLLIKLTRVEEENPFNFHEAIKAQKQVTDVEGVVETVPEEVVAEHEEESDDSKPTEADDTDKKVSEEKEV